MCIEGYCRNDKFPTNNSVKNVIGEGEVKLKDIADMEEY